MVTTSKSARLAEIAARLRFAVVRTSRRLRQDANEAEGDGGLSPTLNAALATIYHHGPLTPSELAERERIRRPTATRIVASLVELGARHPDPRSLRRPRLPGRADRRGLGAAEAAARPQERLPGEADARPRPRGRGDARAGVGDPRAAARRTEDPRALTAALRRSVSSLEIPNYRRYFAGQIVSLSGNWMQMVAEMWLILELTGSGVAVGVTAALQFLPIMLFGAWGGVLADRWPKRSLLIVTQTLMAVPALALWGLTASGAVVPWMVFALVFARGVGERDRQPDPPELRDRDGRRRPGRQRGRPQQRPDPLGAHPRSRRRGHPDRHRSASPPAS